MAHDDKSTDCIVKTLKSLPEAMQASAVIQNPCNMNEIFVIGAEAMNNIYIYNRNTNTFKKNRNDHLTSILTPYPQSFIAKCCALQCCSSNSIIVLGAIQTLGCVKNNYYISFYSIFNSKSLTFDKVATNVNLKHVKNDTDTSADTSTAAVKNIDANTNININIGRNGKAIYNTCALTFDDRYTSQLNGINSSINCEMCTQYLPFWNENSRFNVYKNYLIFSHKYTIGIYDIKDEHNPKLIMYINVSHKFRCHGMVILPTCAIAIKRMKTDDNGNKNIDTVKVLLFGCYGNDFLSSFVEYKINFDELESQSKKEKFGIVTNVAVHVDKDIDINDKEMNNLNKWPNIIRETNSEELSKMLNLDQLIVEGKKKNFCVVDPRHVVRYAIFGCNLYRSRYLMIHDIYDVHRLAPVSTMITFDFETKIWTIHNNIWPVCRKGHALIKSKYNVFLQTMGGLDNSEYCETTSHLCIKLSSNIDWSIEKLLWIAHLKNDIQDQLCPLANLPKDIILFILKFFKKRFVFS